MYHGLWRKVHNLRTDYVASWSGHNGETFPSKIGYKLSQPSPRILLAIVPGLFENGCVKSVVSFSSLTPTLPQGQRLSMSSVFFHMRRQANSGVNIWTQCFRLLCSCQVHRRCQMNSSQHTLTRENLTESWKMAVTSFLIREVQKLENIKKIFVSSLKEPSCVF